jgi:hypothetical protein
MEDEYQPLYLLRIPLQREVWHWISNDHMWDRDDPKTETVVERREEIIEGAVGGLLWVSLLIVEFRFGKKCVEYAVGWLVWVSLLGFGMRCS